MRKFLKIGGIALGFVLLLVAIASGLVSAMMRHFYPSPPQAIYNKPKDPLEAQRQDADDLAKLVAMTALIRLWHGFKRSSASQRSRMRIRLFHMPLSSLR